MVKAVVLGAAGGIGQPLALLLKINPLVTELALYDIVNTPGVAADLSHISTPAKVDGYLPLKNEQGKDVNLQKALKGAQVVVIPAGVPRKPGMTRDDLFKINAGIVKTLAEGIVEACPEAFVLVISNPVNATVPIVVEVFKNKSLETKRIFGVTTLDVVRASTFASAVQKDGGLLGSASEISIPVVGGHSGATIIPLLSQSSHPFPAPYLDTQKESKLRDAFIKRIQNGGDEVVQAKGGAGSATLSMAYAGAEFATKVIRAINGEKNIVTPSYIYLEGYGTAADKLKKNFTALTKAEIPIYFSTRVELSDNGVSKIYPLADSDEIKKGEDHKGLTEYEVGLILAAITELNKSINEGTTFVTGVAAPTAGRL